MPPNMRDYDETFASFEWERPERYNFARDVIDALGQADPEAQALFCVSEDGTEERVTYAALSAASRRLANVLRAAGVGRGDVVILVLGRDRSWWEAMTACIRMGAIASPGTSQLSAKDLAWRFEASNARAVIALPSVAEQGRRHRRSLSQSRCEAGGQRDARGLDRLSRGDGCGERCL